MNGDGPEDMNERRRTWLANNALALIVIVASGVSIWVGLNNDIVSLEERVTSNEKYLPMFDTAKNTIGYHESRIAVLEANAERIQSLVTKLERALNENTKSNNRLAIAIERINGRADNHEGRLDRLESAD